DFDREFRGYNRKEVDQFLSEINQNLHSPKEIYSQVFDMQFRGYNKEQVDGYLDNLIQDLQGR
ncbi:MAG: DivIVA domain-containing protein, partial [Streptococcaceae bacterium]|nr:DivIVA domain-containing protein [Streptococcaceae bacterium]